MTKSFAGIGSRETPYWAKDIIMFICRELIKDGYVLRSGGASGADNMFEEAYKALGGKMEIYLPYNGFNDRYHDGESYFDVWGRSDSNHINKSINIAQHYHPKWNKLSTTAVKMMTRNTHQLLGRNLDDKADFVLCFTDGGEIKGGTGQVLRMATGNEYQTQIFNIGSYNPDDVLHCFRTFYNQLKFWS